MIKTIIAAGCILLVSLPFTGCGGRHILFGTYTEFDVAGVEARSTGEVALTIGYDRGEVAFVPDNKEHGYSVLGTFDSDVRLFSGYYINEVFATGDAAIIAGKGIAGEENVCPDCEVSSNVESQKPLLVTTGTRFGFHSLFSFGEGAASATPFEIMLGYKRANVAVVPIDEKAKRARSVYAEIVIGDGSRRRRAATKVGAPEESLGISPFGEGIIINQSIATGLAAQHLAGNERIQAKLIPLDSFKNKNDVSDGIREELERIGDQSPLFDMAKAKLSEMTNIDQGNISKDNFLQLAQVHLDLDGMEKLLESMKQLK